jgi:hypothetical protein
MPEIQLYGLVGAKGDTVNFSPHVWKTKIDLACVGRILLIRSLIRVYRILGLEYEEEGNTFKQINSELREKFGKEKVTVPLIEVEGDIILDSWVIAEYVSILDIDPPLLSIWCQYRGCGMRIDAGRYMGRA